MVNEYRSVHFCRDGLVVASRVAILSKSGSLPARSTRVRFSVVNSTREPRNAEINSIWEGEYEDRTGVDVCRARTYHVPGCFGASEIEMFQAPARVEEVPEHSVVIALRIEMKPDRQGRQGPHVPQRPADERHHFLRQRLVHKRKGRDMGEIGQSLDV